MSQLTFLEQLLGQRRAVSVSELTARLKSVVEREFIDVYVEGEVSNFRRHSSGHWYFSLKDESASLRCASFRMQNRMIRFIPEDGLHVIARGRLSIYDTRGEYQLIVEFMEPVGAGALQLAFEQLKKRLAAAGLFAVERKRPLPILPRCIGVVTSPTGAAVRDILRVLKRRNEAVSVLIAPVRVQGEGAGSDIARAIRLLNSRKEVDAIIVGRGGGSTEDLSSFNDEAVARAIYNSKVPVISAVGHETDVTIADLVADLRASTPSAAAEMVASARGEMCARIAGLGEDMRKAIRYHLLALRGNLSEFESSRAFPEVQSRIRGFAQRVDDAGYSMESALRAALKLRRAQHSALELRLSETDLRRRVIERRGRLTELGGRLQSSARVAIESGSERVSLAAGKLDSLSPLGVLARGYAIAFDAQGRVIKRAADIASGEQVRVRVCEGEMDCTKN
ncbi:MAG: exodeoxyribonuclease VII large subunit [Acidobacteria bacterium]|nr:MAG: exodeoxyribonuclease VII large subunit [Acidobacteriota bacterium]